MNYFDVLDRGRKAAIYAYLHAQSQAQNFGRGAAAGGAPTKQDQPTPTPEPTPAPTPEPDPTPSEPIEYDMTWYLVHDETTWHEAYDGEDSPLKRYYTVYPEEDLWNVDEQRAVNFNDRWYTGTIDGKEVSCGTTWAADGVQKIKVDDVDYYFEIWSYGLDPKNVALFNDVAMTDPADKTFEIATVVFDPEKCKHCWEGSINAPGANYPWLVVDTKDKYDLSKYEGKIEVEYNGKTYYPFGDEFGNFPKGFAIKDLPNYVEGIEKIDAGHTETIDPSELVVKGYVKVD